MKIEISSRWLLLGGASIAVFFVALSILGSNEALRYVSGYRLLRALVSLMPLTGYVGLFLVLLLENASASIPAEFFLLLAGYYSFVGEMSFASILLVSCFASLMGSLVILLLTKKFGASRIYWLATKLGMKQGTLARNEIRLCGKYGSILMVLSRFVPIYGSMIVLPAGATKTNPLSFLGLSLVGSLGATATYVFLGYFLSPILENYQQFLSLLVIQYIIYSLMATFAFCLAFYALRMLKERRTRNIFLRKAAISRGA